MKAKVVERLLIIILIGASILAARLAFSIVRGNSHGPDGAMFFIPLAIFGLPFAAGFLGFLFYLIPAVFLSGAIRGEDRAGDREDEFFLLGHTGRASAIVTCLAAILAFTPLAH